MKVIKVSGFFLYYGKKRGKPGLVGWITDSSSKLGKTAYYHFTSTSGDKDALLVAMGQELRYLELTEVDPTTPFEGKTIEVEV